jgi:hypothetical protein
MKQTTIRQSLILTVAVLGLTAAARAADSTPVPASAPTGLLGQTYAALTYSYLDLGHTSAHADNAQFEINQSLSAGFDGILTYDFTHFSSASKQQVLALGLRAFSGAYAWGKPYVEAGAGYTWESLPGARDNSLIWDVAVGAEFQAAPALTFTPFVKYQGTPSLVRRDQWDFGVKANYWVDAQWALTVGVDRDSHQNTGFTVGTNFRF